MADDNDELSFFSSLAGFSLSSVLSDLNVPTSGLSNQLGLHGIGFDIGNEDRIGADTGEDWEDEVDKEIRAEAVKPEGGVRVEEGQRVVRQVQQEVDVKQERTVERREKKMMKMKKSVYELFPSFRPDQPVRFTELFAVKPIRRRHAPTRTVTLDVLPASSTPPPAPEVPVGLEPGPAQRGGLAQGLREIVQPVLPRKRAAWESEGSVDEGLRRALAKRQKLGEEMVEIDIAEDAFDPIMIAPWEEDIMWSTTTVPRLPKRRDPYRPESGWEAGRGREPEQEEEPFNMELDSDDWAKSILWTPRSSIRPFLLPFPPPPSSPPPSSTSNSLALLSRPARKFRHQPPQITAAQRAAPGPRDRFNLSNDHLYELSRAGGEGRGGAHRGVRQTFGNLEVQHAYPALKLQLPFYKTRLSKSEARAWHRPALLFPTNVELRFSRVRKPGKGKGKEKGKEGGSKGDGGGGGGGEMRKTGDLTLRDGSNFVVWEFSEEHPPIMSSIGMGSILVNYYRKKSEQDDTIPKADVGAAFVLEPKDESPFLKFGSVEPGQTIPTLYNNLIRAPLFRHKPYGTDFLVIRCTSKGETKYYLREMKALFVVGQTYPVVPVPGPHSRAITTTIKKRLEGIVYKLLKKSKQERIKINRLMKYFPDQNELQMRGRLKELMEYHRRGEHQGFWRLKAKHTLLPDHEILNLVTPESVVLCEAMQVGQRHLLDAGYGRAAEEGGEDPDKVEGEGLEVEQQLAPWIATKNFIHATQNKAMLKLHGEGDPTGRGEAFSFVRVSMKEIFIRAGEDAQEKLAEADARPKNAHRYNVQQQQAIYRSEIDRIWKAQFDSLSRKTEPELSEEEEEQKPVVADTRHPSIGAAPQRYAPITIRDERQFPGRSAFSPPVHSPLAGPSHVRASSQFSRGSSADMDGRTEDDMMSQSGLVNQVNANRVLRITRILHDGTKETEIVRDPNIINVYVKARRRIEEENMMTDTAIPTGDTATDYRMKKRLEMEINRMKRNQERRLTRKNQNAFKTGDKPIQVDRPAKADTSRRCGNCGQIGHMKTNRKCPRYAEFNPVPPALTPGGAMSPPSSQSAFPPYPSNATFPRQGSVFGYPAVSSPLATSPPLSTHGDVPLPQPKLKITLKKH